jgi:hypothetical protein
MAQIGQEPANSNHNIPPASVNRVGYYAAILTTLLTIVTFGIAICTPPLSGPFSANPRFTYPYLDIASRFPRDYIWMYPAIVLLLVFIVLIACIHSGASQERKTFSLIGLSLALMAATVLLLDYYVQLTFIQPSLLSGETDGIALLSQYNPHGIFIALEELGYLLMSLALLCLAPVFSGPSKLEKSICWSLITGFILTVAALILISVMYGINREYRFEVIVIAIDWMVLIVSGPLLSAFFRRNL